MGGAGVIDSCDSQSPGPLGYRGPANLAVSYPRPAAYGSVPTRPEGHFLRMDPDPARYRVGSRVISGLGPTRCTLVCSAVASQLEGPGFDSRWGRVLSSASSVPIPWVVLAKGPFCVEFACSPHVP